ncbi:15038_t:CDS:2 [Entrophospora sp. SA101]|nr:15038_t:CDS:2 [Entrophospora sp. SA101]CAJ0842207.1 590_t:CDS:2 [Entrophospora sp. SA101]
MTCIIDVEVAGDPWYKEDKIKSDKNKLFRIIKGTYVKHYAKKSNSFTLEKLELYGLLISEFLS